MNREIKFRGKSLDNGEWVYGYYLKGASAFIAEDGELVDGQWELHKVTPETVGQYTELKDEEGTEIFEDDILQIKDDEVEETSTHKVEHCGDRDYPAFDVAPIIDCDSNGLSYAAACCGIKVIGNIHDNKNLLEVPDEKV